MADNRDLVNLDDETQVQESGAGASGTVGGDAIVNAAQMFQQQLDQMTQWKNQLTSQMEAMRADGIKLLERQKNLAIEKKRLADERSDLGAHRQQLEQLQSELNGQTQRLSQRAGELEQAQQHLVELQQQREQAERELVARQKNLVEQEARHLAEDVRLRESIEQLEGERRHLLEQQRATEQEREKLNAQAQALAQRAAELEQQSQSVSGREQEVAAGRQEIAQATAALNQHQDELLQRETALAEKIRLTTEELAARAAALQAGEEQLAGERQAFAQQKQELRARLDAFEHEQAEQLEALAAQTKRLSARRSELDATEANLNSLLEARIAQATSALQEELHQARSGHDSRVTQLEATLSQTSGAMAALQQREAQLQQDLDAAGSQHATLNAQLASLQDELKTATATAQQLIAERKTLSQEREAQGQQIQALAQERDALAAKLTQQIEAAKEESAQWQKTLDDARSQSAGGNQALESAQQQYDALRRDYKKLKAKAQEIQKAKDELDFKLELGKEESAKQLETLRQELTEEIDVRTREISGWKQKYDEAHAQAKAARADGAAPDAQAQPQLAALAEQLQLAQQQRDDLAVRLAAVQDTLNRQQEESLLAKAALEGRVQELEQKTLTLESEKTAWQNTPLTPTPQPVIRIIKQGDTSEDATRSRQRLLGQARALRQFRLQIRDTQAALENGRAELAQQREQLRARKENLEQVKRLLEKQEMVMARKLADHNAIKTVAAVGIFVIMVLGGAFLGVYRFVRPVYRGETVVKLAAPQDLQGTELDAWLKGQMEFMRSNDVTSAAWKVLRSPEEHYAMHDVRDEWTASLPSHLTMTLDAPSKTLTMRYTGPDKDGVSQVCNALAAAYTKPGLRDSVGGAQPMGLGAETVAMATPPQFPVEDNRLLVSLCAVAGTLFLSLILVMIFRHFIARQLKEIDQMADAQELDEVNGDLPEAAAG